MNMTALPPLILDFDRSVAPLANDETRIPLHDWQEQMRFSCTLRQFADFGARLPLPEKHGCVFLGSGDYHHLSLLMLQRLAEKQETCDVVVCDNHPDNMRYPFGIHCGSWVYHASKLPSVSHIHVIGITSDDISFKHAWENHLSPLVSRKVSYWSVGASATWLNLLGAKNAHFCFDSADALMAAFLPRIAASPRLYLSIDKDVFREDVVKTNWDQGCFTFDHLRGLTAACRGKLAGADVTGEVSDFTYRGLMKKLLTWRDGLQAPDPLQLEAWQKTQHAFNQAFLALLAE